mmetsp:Transcript_22823/g.33707  ORF Transcript_22823/g.33707 Transcript_22823/m.33707 type:complete len:84 (+) Transcript_22823:459-710(+)
MERNFMEDFDLYDEAFEDYYGLRLDPITPYSNDSSDDWPGGCCDCHVSRWSRSSPKRIATQSSSPFLFNATTSLVLCHVWSPF